MRAGKMTDIAGLLGSGCGAPRQRLQSLKKIVEHYIDHCREDHKGELKFYRNQPSASEAIDVAALAVAPGKKGKRKRHDHQRRISASVLKVSKKRLLRANLDQHAMTFHELYVEVRNRIQRIRGIGPLTVYDAALRIGAFFNRFPDMVYLHADTRKGAKALGLGRGREWLCTNELPHQFRALKPYEIEACLCIYREHLEGLFGAGRSPGVGRQRRRPR